MASSTTDLFAEPSYSEFLNLEPTALFEILVEVEKILDKEPKLIEIDQNRCLFIGDTHGEFGITKIALTQIHEYDKLIFLGDFIDRGPTQIENVNVLLGLKAKYPNKIILIRGNHECQEINIRYGFYEAVLRRYGMKIFEEYNRIFSKLPLAILTWNKIFAVHGGIPEGLNHINEINGLADEINPINKVTFQILWNDPVEKENWFTKNMRGGDSKRFGALATKYFMEKHGINLIIRAHERHQNDHKSFFDNKVISLYSMCNYQKKKEISGLSLEKDGSWKIISLFGD
jgi:diadenosine tetraphosphatase ApaH/serine/threonine PP2A family protein phosphatase